METFNFMGENLLCLLELQHVDQCENLVKIKSLLKSLGLDFLELPYKSVNFPFYSRAPLYQKNITVRGSVNWDVISYPCLNFNSSLDKPALKLGHGSHPTFLISLIHVSKWAHFTVFQFPLFLLSSINSL